MRRALVGALVLLAAIVIPAAPAHACSCAPLTDDVAFARADTVFVGRPVDKVVRDGEVFSSGDPATWIFEVDRVYKGEVAARQGVVTARESSSCGFDLSMGQRALVFVDGGHGDRCNGTRAAGDRSVPASFGEPQAPGEGAAGIPGADPPWWVHPMVVVLAIGAALVLVRATIAACRPSAPPLSSPS